MTQEQDNELRDIVAKATWPAVEKMMATSYNQAIDDAVEVVKVEYAKSGIGIQSPISSPLQGTSRGSMTQKIIVKLQSLKK